MCDSIVAAPSQTADGGSLYAKNSDRTSGECQPFVQFPAAYYARDARVRCTHLAIPQVAETFSVMGHSPWWVWGFEHGVNEHAVAIGNHTVFSKEPIEIQPGLIGMDLVRLGLERANSAREAVEAIAGLVERHGQGGAAFAPEASGYHNSFVVVDAKEGWQLETSNRRWAARRVDLAAVSNHLSIRTDWEIGAGDLERFAVAEGWWPGDERLDVASAYRNPHVPAHVSAGRQRRATELLNASAGRHDVASFAGILRDHADGGPVWMGGDATPEDERYFTLCAHSEPVHGTTASLIAALPADPSLPWPVWISFGTPCTGIFLPVYLHGVVPPALARGVEAPEPDSAWWVFARLQEAASAAPAVSTPRLRAAWAELESEFEAERSGVEAAARASLEARAPDAAAAELSGFMARCTDRVLARATDLVAAAC